MANQRGKISIGGIVLLLIIVYGAFAAVKFLSAGFTTSQIENEIKEALNVRQGGDFTPTVGENAIKDVLDKKGVFYEEENPDAIVVTVEPRTFRVTYYVEYEMEIDLLFFKKTKYVTIDKILDR